MAKKKRKVRKSALIIVCLIALSITGFCGYLIYSVFASIYRDSDQRARKEYIADLIEQRQYFIDEIESIEPPEGSDVDPAALEGLKQAAIYDDIYALLDEYNDPDKSSEISDEYYNEILEIDGFENDASKLLQLMKVIPADYINEAGLDTNKIEMALAWPEKEKYQNPPEKLDENLASIPLLQQWDLDWAYVPYGDSTLALCGQAPLCISMLFSYINKDPKITPAVIAKLAEEKGQYSNGASLSSIFTTLAPLYDINCVQLSDLSVEMVDACLAVGQPVVLRTKMGEYTENPTYIIVGGIDEDRYIVYDPDSLARSETRWNKSSLIGASSQAWAFTKKTEQDKLVEEKKNQAAQSTQSVESEQTTQNDPSLMEQADLEQNESQSGEEYYTEESEESIEGYESTDGSGQWE